jgi:hypothetical protein
VSFIDARVIRNPDSGELIFKSSSWSELPTRCGQLLMCLLYKAAPVMVDFKPCTLTACLSCRRFHSRTRHVPTTCPPRAHHAPARALLCHAGVAGA